MPVALDPWEAVAASEWLRVITQRLPDGLAGATDGTGRIWLDDRLTAVERRCVLTHELIHVEVGREGHQGEHAERWVRKQTARRLVLVEDLLP